MVNVSKGKNTSIFYERMPGFECFDEKNISRVITYLPGIKIDAFGYRYSYYNINSKPFLQFDLSDKNNNLYQLTVHSNTKVINITPR
jgi:hypothetical protein